jgi:moderate conductance mechanosensitive channel
VRIADLEKLPFYPQLVHLAGVFVDLVILAVLTAIALRLSRALVSGLVGGLFAREATEGTAQELSAVEIHKRRETIQSMAIATLRVVILVIAGIMAVSSIDPGIDVAPAIAGLGLVGVALGFGAQSLVRDYLSGAFILIENQYAVGDVVRIAGVSGKVEDFTLRRTTLRDLDGTVHSVPNGLVGVASNMTRTWSRVNVDVTVGHGTDVDRVTGVIDRVGQALADDVMWGRRILDAPRVERVEAIGEAGVTLKVLGSVRAADRWAVAGELRKRLLAAFAEHGIEIPRSVTPIVPGPPAPPDETSQGEDRAQG